MLGCFDAENFNELQMEQHFAANSSLVRSEAWYWIRKLQARYLACDYTAALNASRRAQQHLWTALSLFESVEYHFYTALAEAGSYEAITEAQHQHLETLASHHRQLQAWAESCPENFENRAALVSAEIARLEGRELDAERLYEQAIRSARDNGFVHHEALAYELASRFYAARGFEQFARVYLRHARDGYARWGAYGKVRQLEDMHRNSRKKKDTGADEHDRSAGGIS